MTARFFFLGLPDAFDVLEKLLVFLDLCAEALEHLDPYNQEEQIVNHRLEEEKVCIAREAIQPSVEQDH